MIKFFITILAVILVFEEWLWDVLKAQLHRMEVRIRALSAWASLWVMLVPVVTVLPFKIAGLWALAHGHAVVGVVIFLLSILLHLHATPCRTLQKCRVLSGGSSVVGEMPITNNQQPREAMSNSLFLKFHPRKLWRVCKLSIALPVGALVLILSPLAQAQAYANITIGGAFAPGVYGQIAIGNNALPPVLNVQPVVVGRPVYGAPVVYLYVAPNEYQDWSRHCARYGACGYPVHFVKVESQDPWWTHTNQHLRGEGYYRKPEHHRDSRKQHKKDFYEDEGRHSGRHDSRH